MSSFSVLMSVYYKEQALYLKEALDSIWLNQILKPDQDCFSRRWTFDARVV